MNMVYIALAGFDGNIFLEPAKALISGICDCCATLIDSMSNVDTKSAGSTMSTSISAVATTIATLLVVIELCTQAMGFHFDDINDAVRFAFKVVVYKIIIENSSRIVNLVYGMFINASAWQGVKTGFAGMKDTFNDSIFNIESDFQSMAVTDWLLGFKSFLFGILLLIIALFICAIMIKMIVSIAGLLFELAINITIAPIPIATLVNSQTRQIGINFIKSFAGNCLTLMMYSLCFTVYNSISQDLSTAFGGLIPATDVNFKMFSGLVVVVVGAVLLSTAISNVSTMISKVLS